jgi:pimeloyl-ACP methyl ester carboxylesterase
MPAMLSLAPLRLTALALTVALAACAAGPEEAAGPQLLVQGRGGPVLVLEAGAGDGPEAWTRLAEELSAHTTVVRYQRSRRLAPQQDSRNGAELAAQLHQALRDRGLPPPYVLAGHSLGGPFVLSFARRYPQDVAGLVLVDARPPGFTAACTAAGSRLCDVPGWALALSEPWVRAEMRGLPATYAQIGDLASLPAVPAVVIAATTAPPLADASFQRVWLEQQRLMAQELPRARLVLAEGSGHYVQKEQPALVRRETLAVLAAARAASAPELSPRPGR